ncbi:copper amine oxidase N-terminal domain-containing protein [Paenibacillus terrae]|uniref:Peptidylprolyl isomerase n=1 Tax=Paenibacillus terrae TaxID=159743 RepID=A0A0D7XBA0_9BACL|nr:copper amine oxidase N-terminal domain-containing protein [Paenibacillus terrae]KJD47497.1 peptidylprolyl isomerase [Paenibacillus terrae]
MKTNFFICCLITLLCLNPIIGDATAKSQEVPIHFKVNNFYILYTQPATPFLDQKGRLLIPLKAVKDLLGGKLAYNAMNKMATVNLLGRSVVVTIGSRDIFINGEPVTMDTVPVIKEDAMFLPISVLVKDTDVKMQWDAQRGLLKLEHDSFNKSQVLLSFLGQDLAEVTNKEAFDLHSYEWNGVGKLKIHANYDESLKFSEKQVDIRPLIMYGKTYTMDPYTKSLSKSKIQFTGVGKLTLKRDFGEMREKMQYIIAVGRLID